MDRDTDITKLIVAFPNFANAPKIEMGTAIPSEGYVLICLCLVLILHTTALIRHITLENGTYNLIHKENVFKQPVSDLMVMFFEHLHVRKHIYFELDVCLYVYRFMRREEKPTRCH